MKWLKSFQAQMLLMSAVVMLLILTGVMPAEASMLIIGVGATLNSAAATLLDVAKRVDPDGDIADIVELLMQTNEVLTDMRWMEGNLPTGHRTTVRTGLPSVAWRLLNNGITPSKSLTAQIDEQCGMLEAWSEVDKDLAELNGNSAMFRLSEATAFIEAMNQEMAQTLFYGNAGLAPEEFTGLSVRYSTSVAANADSAQNVIKTGGAGSDNSSIWLIVWGDQTVAGIYPKAAKAGIFHEDEGLVTVENATGIAGARMRAYRDHWQWKCGIAVKDWRYAVRACNVDISNLVTESSAADVIKTMLRMIHRIPAMGMGTPVFYCNRTIREMLDIQSMGKTNLCLASGEEEGKPKLSMRGIPIRLCDQLLETETLVP